MIKKTSTINEEFDLSLFLFIAKKSLIWILLFFIVAILTAFLYVRYASEVYESTSILQIKSNNTAGYGYGYGYYEDDAKIGKSGKKVSFIKKMFS